MSEDTKPAASAPSIAAANRVAVTMQNTDLTLAFGHTRQAYDGEGKHFATATEYQFAVSLSPATAKQLLVILAKSVKQYEEQWGSIGLDPSFIEQVEAKMGASGSAVKRSSSKRSSKSKKAS